MEAAMAAIALAVAEEPHDGSYRKRSRKGVPHRLSYVTISRYGPRAYGAGTSSERREAAMAAIALAVAEEPHDGSYRKRSRKGVPHRSLLS
ncbi:hypothetical protein F511_02202 [Dorcoceras hygrometricum]|uniref:Uncharacterized protein n=1 Tax=Dorcoceras hygrometricum TaxID=472368 RepID=A0A2Z7AND7_9LAMI|nr:hypothetical protein F511_02202 [Dorcoceras hygrometricum]